MIATASIYYAVANSNELEMPAGNFILAFIIDMTAWIVVGLSLGGI